MIKLKISAYSNINKPAVLVPTETEMLENQPYKVKSYFTARPTIASFDIKIIKNKATTPMLSDSSPLLSSPSYRVVISQLSENLSDPSIDDPNKIMTVTDGQTLSIEENNKMNFTLFIITPDGSKQTLWETHTMYRGEQLLRAQHHGYLGPQNEESSACCRII